ncbi:hypothetical protein [Pedobacter sp. MW01-1-1]|uniref:hypothetical protein n=1 Tax=Pedobacter sp. MW01-1-1 TaxID=3383027 RepID=UPI003FEF4CF9
MEFLLETLKNTLSKHKVEKLAAIASDSSFSPKDLIELSFHPNEQIGFRAAWVLENIFSNHPARFVPHGDYFLSKFSQQNNLSALRHYVKILAFWTHKKALPGLKQVLDNYPTNDLAEVVFAWLIDDKIPVAVKSHCLSILANLAVKHVWIKEELLQTIDFQVDKESIAYFAKAKQIRKQLR